MSAEELLADGAVTVAGATREFGIGRTRLYELMGDGTLPYSQVGTRRLIPRVALRRLLAANLHGVEQQVVAE
jgi:excisionase family DNA binding protein